MLYHAKTIGGYLILNFLIITFFITFLVHIYIIFSFLYNLFESVFLFNKQGAKLNKKLFH